MDSSIEAPLCVAQETRLRGSITEGYAIAAERSERAIPDRVTDAALTPPPDPVVCLIGVGPRGTCVIERLGAIARECLDDRAWTLHLVDDAPFGAGRIWRLDQTHELCMNTLSGAVTLFTDEASTVMGPVSPGPTMHEWCLLVRDALDGTDAAAGVPDVHRAAFATTPLPDVFLAQAHLVDEARVVRPESHPSRALYGAYITWCFDHALGALPDSVTEVKHRTRAVGISADGARERVLLADGTTIAVDDVILSPGWLESAEPEPEARLTAAVRGREGLVWVRQGSPVEQELDAVPAGAPTIVRGLGMGFFDAMALLTVGRGGRFRDGGDRLVYEPSGSEPVMHVTSRRGIPFHAKSVWGGLPPAAHQRYFSRFDPSAVDRPIDFERDLWPLIVQDSLAGWYRAIAELEPKALEVSLDDIMRLVDDQALALDAAAFDSAVAPFVPDPRHRFDLVRLMSPDTAAWSSPDAFQEWVVQYVETDLAQARLGMASPLKRALWEVNAARKHASMYMGFTRASAETHASGLYRSFASFGQMIGSGPPAFRNAQLLALADAGLVRFLGPAGQVGLDAHGFTGESALVAGSRVSGPALVDAFMSAHDARASRDPLLLGLADRGVVRPHRRRTRTGEPVPGSGYAVEPGTSRVIGLDDTVTPRIQIIGLPVDDTRGDTVISPMPRVNATFLREADGAAHAALRTLFPARFPADQEVLHV